MSKIKVKTNKPVYLGLSILEISIKLIYEFWYHSIKLKYQNNAKICYMDRHSFVIHIQPTDVYEDVADNVEKRFDTSNYRIERPLPNGKNQIVSGLMKYELGGKIMAKFLGLKPKAYSYLIDDDSSDKKAKGTKKCLIKQKIKFEDNKNSLQNNKTIKITTRV